MHEVVFARVPAFSVMFINSHSLPSVVYQSCDFVAFVLFCPYPVPDNSVLVLEKKSLAGKTLTFC